MASRYSGGLRPAPAILRAPLTRGALFASLCLLGFANGITGQISRSIEASGFLTAVFETFDISVFAWVAFWLCPRFMLEADEQPTRADFVLTAGAVAAFLVPMSWASWIALTAAALYLLVVIRPASGNYPPLRRAAWILLATTGAMFWGRLLLILLGEFILKIDAILVQVLTLSSRYGSAVQFADGGGYLWIAEGCSSLSGISQVILCWTLLSQYHNLRWSRASLKWCGLACLAVSAVNVARMSLMVLDRDLYGPIHGPAGQTVAGWITLILAFLI